MKHSTQTCDDLRLEAFLQGDLSTTEEAELADHLNQCVRCREQLEARAAEPDCWNKASEFLKLQPLDHDESSAGKPERSLQIQHVLDALAPTDDPEMLGRLGRYEVSGVVGTGGMGVVLKAVDSSLDRSVAIKVLSPHLASSGAARKRFAREAKAAAAVLHPNVLAIHSVSTGQSLPYLVMPYHRGVSLQKRIEEEGPLPICDILRIGSQIADGLAAAHAQGLVHRDIKPANILLEDGVERVAITDFGLARAVDDATMTRTGVIAGTPQYMSPEQARGDSVDQRSDLFSLGSVLYTMCTGRPPFRAETSYGIMRRITDNEPQAIREINPDIPEWLCRIITRLMAKQPQERFASAGQVAELLEDCLAHVQQPTTVPPPTIVASHSANYRFSFSRRLVGVIVMIAVFGVGVLGMVLSQATAPPDISGRWTGDGWDQVELEEGQSGKYTGTYTDTFGKQPGRLQLKWSRIERRFNGTWREGEDRFGRISVRLIDGEVRGGWTTDKKSRINAGTPRLADLLWVRPGKELGTKAREELGIDLTGNAQLTNKMLAAAETATSGRVDIEMMPGDTFILKGSKEDVEAAERAMRAVTTRNKEGETPQVDIRVIPDLQTIILRGSKEDVEAAQRAMRAVTRDEEGETRRVSGASALVLLMHPAELANGNSVQQAAASVALGQLGHQDYCGILRFTKEGPSWLWGDDRGLVQIGENRAELLKAVTGSHTGDTPAFDDALRMALQAFKTVDVSHRHMIMLTDGDPSLIDADILTQFRDAEIAISVVHIELHGPRYEAVPKRIAEMTGGDYYHVLNAKPSQIEPIYRRELSRLLHSPRQTDEETRAIFANPESNAAEQGDAPSFDESVERGMQIDRLQRERRLVEPIESRMKARERMP